MQPQVNRAFAAVGDSKPDSPAQGLVLSQARLRRLARTPDTLRTRLALSMFVAFLLLCAGIVASGAPSVVPAVLLTLSASIALASLGWTISRLPVAISSRPQPSQRHTARRVGAESSAAATDLAQELETLEDLRWQASDDAAHLQALLDGQADMIIRRDETGRITFANRAFCRTFALHLDLCLGRPFHPKLIERAAVRDMPDLTEGLPRWAQTGVERLDTANGPRWIAWTHRRLSDDIQSVGRDITDQRRHERALATARDEARAADQAKSRFLASMSHEIRTPMNGILGMAGLLRDTELSAEQQTYTEAVRKSAVTLLALIDEILDFSKIEAGHVEMHSAPVDIIDSVQGVIELLAPRAYDKHLQLAWSHAPDMPRKFLGDETRLRQIIINLVGNAIKFTEQGGISIWVGAEPASSGRDKVTITVRDTGPGLDDDAKSRIFMEFERAVSTGAQHESGTGLGLAIAQRLARRMEGGITVNSSAGEGATFTLSVVLQRIEPPLDAALDTSDPATALSRLQGHRAMIVSPQLIERRTIANYLRANEIAVSETSHAGQAEYSVSFEPDTILIDSSTDLDAVMRVRSSWPATHAPRTVVIGAPGNRARLEKFQAAGVDHFLVRPIRPSTLLAVLAGNVSKSIVSAEETGNAATAGNTPPDRMPPRPVDAKNWRVLIAEDNEINALLSRTIVTRIGCEPLAACNGREAIDAIAATLSGDEPPIDAILMDLHMPIVDGLTATRDIRAMCKAAAKPVPYIVAVTANAFEEDRARSLAAGMDDYLSKPFEPADLRRILTRALDEQTHASPPTPQT